MSPETELIFRIEHEHLIGMNYFFIVFLVSVFMISFL